MAPSTLFEQGAFLLAVKPNQDAGQKTNLKGRLNFSTLGTAPGHIITLSDSNFQKTIATANNRPANDANDAYVGYDQGDGNPANIGITLGAPKSVSHYIANAGDGTNWLERLTANLKEFKTNVQMDGALTVSGRDGEFICINRHRSMERDRKLRYAWHGGIREVVAGIRDKWEAASFRKWSRSSRGGKAGRDREFCRERNHGNSIGAHTDAMQ